jgi:hypothetical protein
MQSRKSRTFQQPHRTFAARVFNVVGRQLRRWGWRRRLSLTDILDSARRWTKLSDWGDERFQEPLGVLLESLEDDAQLNSLGRLLIRINCIHFVSNRLRVQRFLKDHPEVLAEPVRRPVFVVGLPRTGTTLLHNLLCQDRGGRPLLFWEALQPAPDSDGASVQRDRRRLNAQRFVTLVDHWGAPAMKTVHPLNAYGPEECTFMLFNTFVTPAFFLFGPVRGYIDWLHSRGRELLICCYEQFRNYLQVLQWRGDNAHWVLKSPAHSFGLEALLSVFPDARVVQTHRDMNKVAPSACSLFAITQGLYSDDVDPRRLGHEVLQLLGRDLLDRASNAKRRNPTRVFDIHYRSLVADPVGTVSSIYDFFGSDLDEGMEQRMSRWLAKNPVHKHGVHHYDLEQFGLTRADVDRAFGPYPEQVAIDRERPSARPMLVDCR